MRRAAALLLLVAACSGPAASPGPDPEAVAAETGLAAGEGVELVATHCLACHSFRLIVQNRGDAGDWRATIRWLQRTQGLWELEPAEEARIVSYLSTQYPRERRFSRRAPLQEALLPPPPGDRGAGGEAQP